MASADRDRAGNGAGGRLIDRLHARMAGRALPPTGFSVAPEPRGIGSYARGRQLVAGSFAFAGHLIEAPGRPIWDVAVPDPRLDADLHGFAWLDDLAAVGDGQARARAQGWTWDWIARFGGGRGPGWRPDLTGQRLVRWINHSSFLLAGRGRAEADAFFAALARQARFLIRRARTAPPGLSRIEALAGLVQATLVLTGFEQQIAPATQALAGEAVATIDAEGTIPSRNPERLLAILMQFCAAAAALADAGRSPPPELLDAMQRIAHVLRALRHADGGLARFHGGGRGAEGLLDQALAQAPGKAVTAPGLAMGYARLAAGRTTVIVDAAPPPAGAHSSGAHASTLAFELTSGRRPLIVNCGSGRGFGPDWLRAGRATPSHSTAMIRGISSSRLAGGGRRAGRLAEVPALVWVQQETDVDGLRLLAGHDGYERIHGLTHARQLRLSLDGRTLTGEDSLGAMSAADRARLDALFRRTRAAIEVEVRFHLHPDVDAALDLGGTAVSMALKSGEIWILRPAAGETTMRLEPSVYLDAARPRPLPAQQVVLTGTVRDYACHIGWTLAKAQDTPSAMRDIVPDAPAV